MNPIQFNFITSVGTRAYNDLVAFNVLCWRVGMGIGVALIIAALLFVIWACRRHKSEDYDVRETVPFLVIFAAVFAFAGLCTCLCNGLNLTNPKAATLSELTSKN